jgi:hypothetical protein
MADALGWFVLGPDPDDPIAPRQPDVVVHVTVDLPTVRLRDNPADLGRFGTLPPEVARQLAADAQWRLLVHDPVDGHLLNQGRRSYRPKAHLEGYVSGRDVTCRFPGSRVLAKDDDTDHIIAFNPQDPSSGETSADNLAKFSRRAHRVKTFLGFRYRHLGKGVLEWTTPLGRVYRTRPHDYRPDGDGDPPDSGDR